MRREFKVCSIICHLISVGCLMMVLMFGQTVYAGDNVVWEKNMDISLNRLTEITYGKGVYIVVDSDGGIRTSTDAINWTARNPGVNAGLYSIACNKELFVAGGINGTIITSTDGIEWKSIELGEIEKKYTISKIIWDGKQFVAIGGQNVYGIIMTSPDGITWTTRISETVEGFNSIIYNGDIYAVVGIGGNIYTSADAISWTKVQSGLNKALSDIAWNGEKFVAVNFKGNIFTSVDGTQWTVNSIENATFLRIIWDGKQFVTSCIDGEMYTSTDGVSWTKNMIGENISYCDFIYHGGRYIGIDGEKVLSSEDLLNWTINCTFGIDENLSSIAYNGKIFVIAGYGKVLTSTDGENWTFRETLRKESPVDIVWDGKRFVAVESSGGIMVSYDGENWIAVQSPTSTCFSKIVANEELLIAIDTSRSVYRSTDGLEWEFAGKIIEDNDVRINDIFWDGSRFVLVGAKCNWEDYYWGLDTPKGVFATSLDGTEWTLNTFDDIHGFSSVVYNGKKYIASNENIYELTDLNTLTIFKSINLKSYSVLLWNNDRLFGISNGSGKESLFASEDGKTWTPVAASYGTHLYELAFYGDRYFALGTSGTLLTGKIEESEYLAGDINNDKNVNSIDFALLRKYLLGKTYEVNLNNADINKDEKVNSLDFAILRKILLGYGDNKQ